MICSACNREIPVDGKGLMVRHKITKSSSVVCEMSGPNTNPAKKEKSRKKKARRPAAPRICPVHGMALVGCDTSYGKRYGCPISGCTVAAWGGSTSTPADDETRAARIRAHDMFDPLWMEAGWTRSAMYRALASHMRLEQEKCHIGMFNAEQCEQVIEFCKTFRLSSREPVAPCGERE